MYFFTFRRRGSRVDDSSSREDGMTSALHSPNGSFRRPPRNQLSVHICESVSLIHSHFSGQLDDTNGRARHAPAPHRKGEKFAKTRVNLLFRRRRPTEYAHVGGVFTTASIYRAVLCSMINSSARACTPISTTTRIDELFANRAVSF